MSFLKVLLICQQFDQLAKENAPIGDLLDFFLDWNWLFVLLVLCLFALDANSEVHLFAGESKRATVEEGAQGQMKFLNVPHLLLVHYKLLSSQLQVAFIEMQ